MVVRVDGRINFGDDYFDTYSKEKKLYRPTQESKTT